jgi:hypothetical protein
MQRRPVELGIAAAVFFSCAYFFQGGGWNQNSHFATAVALVEDGTVVLDRYRESTGDLSYAPGDHVVSAKPIGTALVSIPAYLVARTLTALVGNDGNRIILRAYLTSLFTAGAALTMLAVLLYRLLLRRLEPRDAALLALATALATPLFPNSTMLTSHPLASLAALSAWAVLSSEDLSSRRLVAAGALAMAPGCFEYQLLWLVVPFGLYALWRARARAFWMLAGALPVLAVPLTHHTLTYGDPFRVGYQVLIVERMAKDAAVGFIGFDGFSFVRLYELTFGTSRGFFFLSPYLVANVPGLARLWRVARSEALLTGGIAWGMLCIIASLVYWHSGSAVGSRYALVFVTFAAFGVAAILPYHRGWISAGIAVGFVFMLMATSVTAIPPTPRAKPPYENVLGWYWERFDEGRVASWQAQILIDRDAPGVPPTLPYSFNLGQALRLPGRASLLPYLAGLSGILLWLGRRT